MSQPEDYLRSSGKMYGRIDQLEQALIQRFENMIAIACDTPTDRDAMAVSAHQMQIETGALIKATEDILGLTRQMKELWLFGPLRTVGTSAAEEKTQEDAKAVGQMLEKLLKTQRDVAIGPAAEMNDAVKASNGA